MPAPEGGAAPRNPAESRASAGWHGARYGIPDTGQRRVAGDRVKPTGHDVDVTIAVTFAEAGEWETARSWAPPPGRGRVGAWLERHLLAAAFAEEGEHDEALRLVGAERPRPPPDPDALDALLRARGVRMSFGVLSPAALSARR